jgi:hypothetical protein
MAALVDGSAICSGFPRRLRYTELGVGAGAKVTYRIEEENSMEEVKNPRQAVEPAPEPNGECEGLVKQHGFLIRVADRQARLRAIDILGWVQVPYCGVPGDRWLVANEHIEALKREGIPFEVLA